MKVSNLFNIAKDIFIKCITVVTGCTTGILAGILVTAIVVGIIVLSLGLILVGLGLEYFVLAILSKGLCYLLGIPWMGWIKTLLFYIGLVIVRNIYYELQPED